jgi:serine O-acetyltransferase
MKRALRRIIERRSAGYDGIVLWGAGSSGRAAMELLPKRPVYVVDSFSDAEQLDGLPVVRPDRFKEESGRYLLYVASFAAHEIGAWCDENEVALDRLTLTECLSEIGASGGEFAKLRVDLLMYYQTNWFESFVTQPQMLVNISYRLNRALKLGGAAWQKLLLYPTRVIHAFTCAFFGIEIPITVAAGAGLQFIHGGGIVLHEDVSLGDFCKIYQCVTMGADRRGRVPRLGSNVIVWSNAVLIGGCRLGDHTQVGANAVCLGDTDVEDAILVGMPAKPVGSREAMPAAQDGAPS